LVAVLAEADGQVLRLERHFPNASTDELVKLDQRRQARQGLDAIARFPVAGGYSYPDMMGG
jgi:hypothetical protein